MAWRLQTIALEVPDTEELIDSGPKRALVSDSFCFAVTKEAVYLPTRKKGLVLRGPIETTRVPLSSIRGVALCPARADTRRITWTLLTLVLVLLLLKIREWPFGLLFLTAVYMYSFICIIIGPRGRNHIQVDMRPQPLNFEPRLESIISAEAKAAELEVQIQFLDACRRAGLTVVDSRDRPSLITRQQPGNHF